MKTIGNRSIDVNSVLMSANLLIGGLLVVAFARTSGNEYVDQETMLLGVILSIQTHLALWLEKKRRDPFILLLAFSMTFYYLFRLVTLTLFPYSLVFDRYGFHAGDSNYALILIIVANIFLYAGFYIVRFKGNQKISAGNWRATSAARVVVLMLAAIIFAYTGGKYWNEENIPRIFNFLVIFLSQNIVLLMALSYYFLFKKTITRKAGVMIVVLIVVEMAAHTLMGSRGAIVGIVQNYMVATLAIASCIQFRKIYVYLGIVLLPVVVVLLIGSFAISTYNRANRDSGASLDVGRALELAGEATSDSSLDSVLDLVVPLVAARAGFFDFSAEIIAHRDEYRSVINLSSYARSIIDNILTPGFDIYDQPKISNALQFVYQGLGPPSKERVTEQYQSDQLGIYGEFYGLFGFASLPVLFLIAFLLKRIYVGLKSANPFILLMKRVVVLFVFVRLIDSFGVDWTIAEALPLVVAIFIYRFFFSSKPTGKRETPHSPESRKPNADPPLALRN